VGNIKCCTASGVGPQCRKVENQTVWVGNTMESLKEVNYCKGLILVERISQFVLAKLFISFCTALSRV
jgi:hypothetical protein